MQPSEEKIVETIREVMSLPEFRYNDPYNYGFNLPDLSGWFYATLIAIICFVLFYAFKLLIDNWVPFKKKKQQQPVRVIQKGSNSPLPTNPIERLHAEMLITLQKRKLLLIQKWKTNFDYVTESGNPIFKQVCVHYDAAVYGTKKITEETISSLKEEYESWKLKNE